jgi:hypothetical protein
MIPIVNLIIFGYLLEVARTAHGRKYEMPGFKGHFVKGLIFLLISFIFGLPLFVFGYYGYYYASGFASLTSIYSYKAALLIITLLTAYILPCGLVNYAINCNFMATFQGLGHAFTKKYFLGILVGLLYSVVINLPLIAFSFLFEMIPLPAEVLGLIFAYLAGIAFFLSKTALFTILGEIHK